MTTDYDRIDAAIHYVAEHATDQPTLDEIAGAVGLSPGHLQRVFSRWAGVSPKRFLQYLTVEHAKRLLDESRPVLDAAFEVGLSSGGRLHDLFVTVEAVTPGEYKSGGAGLEIRYGVHDSPFGPVLIATTERGVCDLWFIGGEGAAARIDALRRSWSGAELVEDGEATGTVARAVFDRAGGGGMERGTATPGTVPPGGAVTEQALPLLLKGTNFQLQVWRALLRVPEGCLVSYSDLAARLGRPSSARAVANAVGANPIGYVIPCHRVLRSTGDIGGYAGGIDRKRAILAREAAGRD